MQDALTAVTRHYARGSLDGMRSLLPKLIHDTNVLASLDPRGVALRVQVMKMTGQFMTQTRQYDAAEVALRWALSGAPDVVYGAAVINTQCWLLLRSGRLAEARELAVQWADDTEPRISRATPSELEAWGRLLLRVATASARDNRPEEAAQALALAESAAAAIGRRRVPFSSLSLGRFSRFSVEMKRAEHAMVEDRPDAVLALASRIPTKALSKTSANNWNRYLLDVAQAQTRLRKYPEAIGTLKGVWRDAPQWLPHQRYARDIVQTIIGKRRTLTPDMRALADIVRLPM
ncbi:transcriptional regulator [Streptomyces sp. B1866]|uniref:transcriptional regulator n=1 Tax=Streptomyces sp. B1866 TaxID=3075431 RepID=UPI00288FCA4E|nr:transcriptional regulator [Streptomyces sp. B1866]MDT3397436.1 transcriptional regulator [Streptomyces sp. B1866]